MVAGNGEAGAPQGSADRNGENLDSPTNTKSKPDLTILLNTVAELFPVFAAEGWQEHRPLAIGIDKALIETGIVKPFEAGLVLSAYTRRRMYLTALAGGGPRFSLDGTPSGEVSPEQVHSAKLAVASLDRKAAEAAKQVRAEHKKARQAATAAADKPKGPAPYHKATSPKTSPQAPQPADQPRRLGLADLKRAAQARKQASQLG